MPAGHQAKTMGYKAKIQDLYYIQFMKIAYFAMGYGAFSQDLKTGEGESLPWVQIPPPPPYLSMS